MCILKEVFLYFSVSMLLCFANPQGGSAAPSDQEGAAGRAPQLRSEAEVTAAVDSLMKDGNVDEALAELDEALLRFPQSISLFRKKYEVLWSAKRFEDCLQLLDAVYPSVPADVQKLILSGKRLVLFELVRQSVAAHDTQAALKRLQDLADAGYRGFHDLNRDSTFESLWELPRYKKIQEQIRANAGIGKPAVDFTAALRDGSAYRLSEHRGKVVLVEFWSTSCVPCIKELPNLRTLHQAYAHKGFEIISISLDVNETVLERFLSENPLPGQLVFSGKGFDEDIARLYEVSWVPSYWLVDRRGTLRYYDVRGEDLKSAVKQLIGEE